MGNRQYPYYSGKEKRFKNTSAKCHFCHNIGKYRATIQWNWFRGDDDVIWVCEDHYHPNIIMEFITGDRKEIK